MNGADEFTDSPESIQAALRARPAGRVAGYQRWSDLLFVHWRVPVAEIAARLPPGLEVDTFNGEAWLGLVPFQMSGVRPWWFPSLPGISAFPETNLRTYVRCGGEPGVHFFSLEASKALAVWFARWRWHLPYWLARMELLRDGNRRTYRSQRVKTATAKTAITRGETAPEGFATTPPPPAYCQIIAELGDKLASPEPGSLEFFLVERYLLFANSPGGLRRGQVHHVPYPVRQARLVSIEQSLSAAAGFGTLGEPDHVLFSPGVRVEVFPLTTIV